MFICSLSTYLPLSTAPCLKNSGPNKFSILMRFIVLHIISHSKLGTSSNLHLCMEFALLGCQQSTHIMSGEEPTQQTISIKSGAQRVH